MCIRDSYIFQQGKDYFYLQPELTLLTPECIWYPTGIPPVNVLSPQLSLTDYCQFRLSVIGEKERCLLYTSPLLASTMLSSRETG